MQEKTARIRLMDEGSTKPPETEVTHMQRCYPFNINGLYLELINPPPSLGRTPRQLSALAESLLVQIRQERGDEVQAARVVWRDDGAWLATEPCCSLPCCGV